MAHQITRIEGFEGGPTGTANVLFDGAQGSAFSVQSAVVRSGEYALRVNPPATTSTHAVQIGAVWNPVGDRIDSTNYNASCWRIPTYVKDAYPAATTRIITLLNAATTAIVTIDMTSAGLLVLDGVTGTTPVALNTWTVLEIKKDGTAPLRELRINGAVELSNATAGSGINRVNLGKSSAASAAAYDIYFDDIVVEAAALIASIDYPGALLIRRIDVDGDGFYDGVWTASTGADAWQSVDLLEDGDSSLILSPAGASAQTFTLESTSQAGISASAIHAVQFSAVQKRTGGLGSNTRMRLRSGGVDNEITALNSLSATYAHYANLRMLSPFTGLAWTTAELDAIEFGLTNTASANTVRCTCMFGQVAYLAAVEGGGSLPPSLPVSLPTSLPAVVEAAPIFCAAVIFDPGGAQEYDLSGRLVSMRPLRQERDIVGLGYRGQDVDLEFADPDGNFVEQNPLSFLLDPTTGEPNWYGKPVLIAALMGSTVLVRTTMYVLGASATRAGGNLRLGSLFQKFAEQPVYATAHIFGYPTIGFPIGSGKTLSTENDPGIMPVFSDVNPYAPLTGAYVRFPTLPNNEPFVREKAARLEEWTITWQSAFTGSSPFPKAEYVLSGSETGFDGVGTTDMHIFDSISGAIRLAGIWVGRGASIAVTKESKFKTVWRPARSADDPAFAYTSAALLKTFLLDPRGAALSASDLDPSIDALMGTVHDQAIETINLGNSAPPGQAVLVSRFVLDTPGLNVLDAIEELARHCGVQVIEKSNGKIGVVSVLPRTVHVDGCHTLDRRIDLMSLEIDHLPIYNDFRFEYGYDERFERYTGGGRYPRPPQANNASLQKYGRLYSMPRAKTFKGFTSSQVSFIASLQAAAYVRYQDPRPAYRVKAKIDRLGADLSDVYAIDSENPAVTVAAADPVDIAKMLTGDLTVDMTLVDGEDLIATSIAECGYLSYDTPPQGYDQCWGYL